MRAFTEIILGLLFLIAAIALFKYNGGLSFSAKADTGGENIMIKEPPRGDTLRVYNPEKSVRSDCAEAALPDPSAYDAIFLAEAKKIVTAPPSKHLPDDLRAAFLVTADILRVWRGTAGKKATVALMENNSRKAPRLKEGGRYVFYTKKLKPGLFYLPVCGAYKELTPGG